MNPIDLHDMPLESWEGQTRIPKHTHQPEVGKNNKPLREAMESSTVWQCTLPKNPGKVAVSFAPVKKMYFFPWCL